MLICLGIDFRLADLAMRERFHADADRVASVYRACGTSLIRELAMITTCNRIELYAWLSDGDRATRERATRLLARRWMRTRADGDALLAVARRREGADAARHLARVTAGLESQILGDGQILGQVRSSYREAVRAEVAGPVLHRLFETAFRTAKRVQHETALSAGRHSVGAEAARVAARRFGALEHARIVLVGAGKTSQRAAKALAADGARDIVVLNRTLERADALAAEVGGRSAPLERVAIECAMADIVIAATGSDQYVLRSAEFTRARETCATDGYPCLLLDLGVPRNIDPRIGELAHTSLIDLDSLQQPVLRDDRARTAAIPAAAAIVESEIVAFLEWLVAMPARAAIQPLREALEDVARREVAFASGDASVAQRTASRIVAKMLAGPMSVLRRAALRGDALDAQAMMLLEMFAPAEPEAETRVARRRRTDQDARGTGLVTSSSNMPTLAAESVSVAQ